MAKEKKVNYLSNAYLLKEIQNSKLTFCWYDDDKYKYYDLVVASWGDLNDELLEQTRSYKESKSGEPVTLDDLVIRVMTYDHMPYPSLPNMGKNSPISFIPFIHVIRNPNCPNGWQTVLKSHHRAEDEYSPMHGRMTERLGKALLLLVQRIASKGNFSGYSYRDEMMHDALLMLTMNGLNFNESRGKYPNPFAYYTAITYNAFRRRLTIEKTKRNLRDDLLELSGQNPSTTRLIENEIKERKRLDDYINRKLNQNDMEENIQTEADTKPKRGRPRLKR